MAPELLAGNYFHNTLTAYSTVDGKYIGSFDAHVVKPTGVCVRSSRFATKK